MLANQFFAAAKISDYSFDKIFYDLYGGAPRCEGYDGDLWKPLLEQLSDTELARPNALSHPHFQREGAVSLTIDEVESLWTPIAEADDWLPLEQKIADIRDMRSALNGIKTSLLPKITTGPVD